MTAAPTALTPVNEAVTLQDIINFAAAGKASVAEVSRGLTTPINVQRFRSVLGRIDMVVAATRPNNTGKGRQQFAAQQNRLKGKLFEKLVGMILEACQVFSIYGNIQTLTNEIDWLVYLAPLRILIPALGAWGPHFICECKMSSKALDGNWITRSYTLTQTHGTEVAVLFTAKEVGNKGAGSRPLRAIQDLSILSNPAYILRINLAELIRCVESGDSPLIMLSEKYMELKHVRSRVGILTA